MGNNSIIRINNLKKTYNNGKQNLLSLKDLSLEIELGKFTSIVGPSGCGKTTLLKNIAGLLDFDDGEIIIPNQDKLKISFVFQEPNLLPWLTVRQNAELPLMLRKEKDSSRIEYLLDLVGLKQFADSFPNELSGGMKQRVSLARSLVIKPDILLMDEPFGSLDEITRNKLNDDLLKIQAELGFTCIFVTHSISEAVFLSDQIIVLSDRPARFRKKIKIEIEKPRKQDVKYDLSFTNYKKCLRNFLQQD